MAYRYGDRSQMKLFPDIFDDYIFEYPPVRVYDAFIESLNLKKMGMKINPHKVRDSAQATSHGLSSIPFVLSI